MGQVPKQLVEAKLANNAIKEKAGKDFCSKDFGRTGLSRPPEVED